VSAIMLVALKMLQSSVLSISGINFGIVDNLCEGGGGAEGKYLIWNN